MIPRLYLSLGPDFVKLDMRGDTVSKLNRLRKEGVTSKACQARRKLIAMRSPSGRL